MAAVIKATFTIVASAFLVYGVAKAIDLTTAKEVKEPRITLNINDENRDKFGGKHANFLLSVNPGDNTKLWTERAFNLYNSNLTSGSFFENAKSQQNLSLVTDELKKACESKYKTDKDMGNDSLWAEVWAYCSIDGRNYEWEKQN
ncbi:hypothetical protein MHSWG343_06360 [Candidatus Mycoplasma haematohominis]|uniref:Uncharacterized protein n=1 Tax=Candidatus Mycoplasma haematohominis TaxID=1494318 RepID=A0A478FT33_9MOLU|nr:hypothetical protein MHSWG343_06360 [Candidatus Mycoplasma haemohominis]